MDPALAQAYEKLKDRLSEAAFLKALDERRDAFGGLLDDETLALLLLDEEGLNEGAVVTVEESRGRPEATTFVQVEEVFPVRTFEKKNGTGRVGNVLVRDATGEARLTLWGRDADKTEDGTLKPGDRVKIVNARVKETRWGLEFHVGPWSVLEVEGALDPAHLKLLTDTQPGADPTRPGRAPSPQRQDGPRTPAPTTLRAFAEKAPAPAAAGTVAFADVKEGDFVFAVAGTLVALEPTRTFRRKDGAIGFVTNAVVEDDSGKGVLTLWDEAVREIQEVKPGDTLRLTALSARARDGRLELHTTRDSKITRG